MKKHSFMALILLLFFLEIAVLASFMCADASLPQDTVAVNEVLKRLEGNWPGLDKTPVYNGLDYVVLDETGRVLCRTAQGLSESVSAATAHRDTILDIRQGEKTASALL